MWSLFTLPYTTGQPRPTPPKVNLIDIYRMTDDLRDLQSSILKVASRVLHTNTPAALPLSKPCFLSLSEQIKPTTLAQHPVHYPLLPHTLTHTLSPHVCYCMKGLIILYFQCQFCSAQGSDPAECEVTLLYKGKV